MLTNKKFVLQSQMEESTRMFERRSRDESTVLPEVVEPLRRFLIREGRQYVDPAKLKKPNRPNPRTRRSRRRRAADKGN